MSMAREKISVKHISGQDVSISRYTCNGTPARQRRKRKDELLPEPMPWEDTEKRTLNEEFAD
jgi:hypothetical protein